MVESHPEGHDQGGLPLVKKRRASKLDAVEPDLMQWLGTDRLQLAEAQSRLAARGIKVSIGRLSTWWADRQQERLEQQFWDRIANGSRITAELDRQFAEHPAPGLESLIGLLKVLVAQCSVEGTLDPDKLALVPALMRPVMEHVRNAQKAQELALDVKKFEAAERRAAQADRTEAALADTTLTDEQRRQRIAEIYGRA